MNSKVELHDTTVEAIARVGTQVVLLLRACLHRSEGKPGIDAGTCWVQAVALVLSDATTKGQVPEFPADISNGFLKLSGGEVSPMIPIPFHYTGDVSLQLAFAGLSESPEIVIRGKRLVLTLLGEALFTEKFNP